MGEHTRSKHKGMSKSYSDRINRWKARKNDRMVHSIAKELYMEIKEDTLDDLTMNSFKQKKKCLTKVELAYKAQKERIETKLVSNSLEAPELIVTTEQIQNSDKSKIRRIKMKIWSVLKLPRTARDKLMAKKWRTKLNEIKVNSVPEK